MKNGISQIEGNFIVNWNEILLNCYQQDEILKSKHRFLQNIWAFRAVRKRFRNYILNKCQTDFVVLGRQKMHVKPNESLKLIIQDYRGFHSSYLKNHIKQGNVVLDIGANIGYFTCLLSNLVGKSGYVYAFEPEPNNFKLLKKNVEENNCQNVTIEQKAVCDKTGKQTLNISPESTGHSLYEKLGTDTVLVDTISLDDYFNDTKVDYIKSDAQGADYPMVLGMTKLLERSKKLSMMLEFSVSLIRSQGGNPEDFLNLLKNLNFEFNFVKFYFKKPKPITYEKMLELVQSGYSGALLCVRN